MVTLTTIIKMKNFACNMIDMTAVKTKPHIDIQQLGYLVLRRVECTTNT